MYVSWWKQSHTGSDCNIPLIWSTLRLRYHIQALFVEPRIVRSGELLYTTMCTWHGLRDQEDWCPGWEHYQHGGIILTVWFELVQLHLCTALILKALPDLVDCVVNLNCKKKAELDHLASGLPWAEHFWLQYFYECKFWGPDEVSFFSTQLISDVLLGARLLLEWACWWISIFSHWWNMFQNCTVLGTSHVFTLRSVEYWDWVVICPAPIGIWYNPSHDADDIYWVNLEIHLELPVPAYYDSFNCSLYPVTFWRTPSIVVSNASPCTLWNPAACECLA